MMLFVAGQRLTPGLRELETFHEAACIRLATGIGLYNDIEKGPMGTYYAPLVYIAGGLIYRIFPGIPGCGRIISIMSVIITAVFVYRIAADRRRCLVSRTAVFIQQGGQTVLGGFCFIFCRKETPPSRRGGKGYCCGTVVPHLFSAASGRKKQAIAFGDGALTGNVCRTEM